MAGPTPISAPHRFRFSYQPVSLGTPHFLDMFVSLVPSGDVTGYDAVNTRSGTNVPAHSAIDAMWTLIKNLYDPTIFQFGGTVLQQRVGTAYVDLYTYSTAVVPTGTGSVAMSQLMFVGKDGTNKFMKPTLFAQVHPVNQRWIAYAAAPANVQGVITGLFNVGGTPGASDPWFWWRSRDDNGPAQWKSALTKTNDKLRKANGLA